MYLMAYLTKEALRVCIYLKSDLLPSELIFMLHRLEDVLSPAVMFKRQLNLATSSLSSLFLIQSANVIPSMTLSVY